MRRTLRLFAAVKPARYLEAGTPTGLTGLQTHATPRATLMYLYTRTLEKLERQIPATSLYRQSVEALTRQRLSVVEAAEPPGYAAWAARAREVAAASPDRFEAVSAAGPRARGAEVVKLRAGGRLFLHRTDPPPVDERVDEWDGERDEGPGSEGLRGEEERREHELLFTRRPVDDPQGKVDWEPEPQLTADQIEEIENKIGGGLIEEVIQRAEYELKLVDIMHEAKVWEDLEEKPAEGQWTYFERNSQ